ncbi:MAG: ribosome assembly factor SBDS [Candidatus Altiarchaeales archaeon]|nr:ribosome assembly factor SBDS [Candidatus Altiarchaeales archaeon]MBD3416511.1 ribosome assembly factor SBDS [Candidatus Altiarchaeales archaeon]
MVSLDDAIIIRLKTHGENYEVYVDPDKVLEFKSGDDVELSEVLAADHVFKDAKAGDKASEEHLMELFKVDDMESVFKEIISKGDLHLTTEQKKHMMEDRRKQVASIISMNAVNPQTGKPHPLQRIMSAMEEARAEITISKSANEQVEKVLKALKPLIPIKFEKLEVAVKIPPEYSGKMYNVLREFGEVKKEDWVGGEQFCLVEIPAGMQDEFYSRLNSMTHGEVKTKVVKHD